MQISEHVLITRKQNSVVKIFTHYLEIFSVYLLHILTNIAIFTTHCLLLSQGEIANVHQL